MYPYSVVQTGLLYLSFAVSFFICLFVYFSVLYVLPPQYRINYCYMLVPPFAIPPDSSHFPQVPPVHIPGHIPMGPHGLPLGMLPAQLALQAQLSQHLGLHPYPPHMLARPGPGLLPTPPNQRGGRGRGGDRRRRGGFW